MFTSILPTNILRVTTTGLIAAFLAVCTASVAPGSAAATPTAATSVQSVTVLESSSGQSTQNDGFHW